MLQRLLGFLTHYLMIDELHLSKSDPDVWKLSVLRIILIVGVTLTSAIVFHSSYIAIQQQLYYVVYLTCGFTVLLWGTLMLSRKQIKLASVSLPLIIVLAGFCILFFTTDIASARYGLLFFFTLPIILRLFYGNKVALISMGLNIIPYIVLMRNTPIPPLFGIDITLPETHTYLGSLIFLFFNICLPMGVIRVMSSLENQSSQNKAQSQKLQKMVHRYQEIFNNGGTPSFFCDPQGQILQANKGGRKLIHEHNSECNYIQQLFELTTPLTEGIKQKANIKGRTDCVFEIHPASLRHHKKQLIHCFDISQAQKKVKKFDAFRKEHIAKHYFDELTGLRNHHYWNHAEQDITLQGQCVVLLKLAGLRDINIQYGFTVGDQLLVQVSKLLQHHLPPDVMVYFFPGAKFVLRFKSTMLDKRDTVVWLEKLLPEHVSTKELEQTSTLLWRAGFTLVENSKQGSKVIESCSIALSQTSETRPFVAFDPNTIGIIRQHTQHKDRVKYLIDNNLIVFHLQPQVSLDNRIIGYEALARLHEPENNTILHPGQFIPAIEQNGWHVLFSRKVLDRAFELLQAWPASMPEVPLAINISGPELLDDLFYEKLLRRFSESSMLCERLELELTETSVLASHVETKRRLSSLARVGAKITIDDFGTGHASLSQLIDMPASTLKVDREFVDRIANSERHRKIIKMTLELARSLGMATIAEGVETQVQLQLLKKMGFTRFQGYYFGKPAPVEVWEGVRDVVTLRSDRLSIR